MGKKPKFIIRLALVIGGMIIAIALLEVALRVLPFPNRFTLQSLLEEQWQSDPELLLALKPDLDMQIYGHPEFSYRVQTNSDGLRNDPFQGDYAIAAVGDSFTFGFGVEANQAWPFRLEAITSQRVANLGWAGWSSHVYPIALERHAIPLNAKTWLWAFFINDLPESADAEIFLNSGHSDYYAWQAEQGNLSSELPFPFNLKTLQLIAALFNPDLFVLPNSGSQIVELDFWELRISDYPWVTSAPEDPKVRRGWELTGAALAQAKRLSDQHEAELVLIFVPAREHVYWPQIQFAAPDLSIAQLDAAEVKLAALAAELDIGYINLLPGFQAAANNQAILYFATDGHWNPDGHDLAAQLIADYLTTHQAPTSD